MQSQPTTCWQPGCGPTCLTVRSNELLGTIAFALGMVNTRGSVAKSAMVQSIVSHVAADSMTPARHKAMAPILIRAMLEKYAAEGD